MAGFGKPTDQGGKLPTGAFGALDESRGQAPACDLLKGQLVLGPRQCMRWDYAEMHPPLKETTLAPADCC